MCAVLVCAVLLSMAVTTGPVAVAAAGASEWERSAGSEPSRPAEQRAAARAPVGLAVTPVVTGLTIPWDLFFTADGSMVYNERDGRLWVRRANGAINQVTADFSDLWRAGEGGLMGMVQDPDFSSNRRFYTCQTYQASSDPNSLHEVRVLAWTMNAGFTGASRVGGPLVSGARHTALNHFGCRLRFDNDKLMYVSIGDSATGSTPQDLSVLNGKILRITTTGAPAPGNPFLNSANPQTRLIYTVGHRNPQGLSLRPGTNDMWSVEQGTDADDEVNRLVPGGNYGWNPLAPGGGYDQSTPMTNPNVPGAIPAVFTTGRPTLALSGGAWLSGPQWGPWNGAFVAAALKASSVRVLSIAGTDALARVDDPSQLQGFGRLRSPLQGPDGNLYLTTSNGGGTDQILKVTPTPAPGDGRCYGSRDVSSTVAVAGNGTAQNAYVIGTNGGLYTKNIDGTPPFTDLGGVSRYGPAAVSWGDGRADVFVVGTNSQLYHRFSDNGPWSGWEPLGGVLTSTPAALSFSSGTLEVLARGTDGALWRLRWTGAAWSGWSSLGGQVSGSPSAAVDRDTGVAKVGVRGNTGELTELTLRADGGATGFTTTGIPVCNAPGYATRTGDGERFRWASTDADGAPALVDGSVVNRFGGTLTGPAALTTPGVSGFAVLGRGTDGALWIHDARSGVGGWRSLGGVIR